jgi:hypothetical protein
MRLKSPFSHNALFGFGAGEDMFITPFRDQSF